jgi:hypothetical protein
MIVIMKLHEEFKLFEDMWDDVSYVPATSSVKVGLNGYNGTMILNKKRVPHKEAYKALLKTLESIANEDLTELYIYWIPDDAEGSDQYDPIIEVRSFQDLVDDGEDPDEAAANGFDIRLPRNRIVEPGSYSTDDLGLPYSVYDDIEELLTPKADRADLEYVARFRDDVMAVFYEGSKEACQQAADMIASSPMAKSHGGVVVHRKGQAHS